MSLPQRIRSSTTAWCAVELLEPLDPPALLVGDEDLEAVAVLVAEGELGARVRPLAAADGAGACRPAGEVEGKLGNGRPFPLLALLGERRPPGPLRQGQDRLPDRLGQVEADREAKAALDHVVEEGVAGAARVGAHKQARAAGLLGRLLDGEVEDLDVVARGVGAGVARPQDAGEALCVVAS